MLPLGDTQYEDGTLAQFQGSYDPSWGRVKSITRPVIGNHEYHFGSGGSGYWDYFNGVGSANGPAGERGKGWYSFDVGDWHLIALNSMCPEVGGCGAGSEQEQWLRADLAANSDASCTIAYWHHPLFNSGPEGSYADTPWNTTALWQALYEAGADLVLTAHAHRYERFAPQDPFGNADPQSGLREFVVGTGGSSLQPVAAIQPNSEFGDSTHFGVIKLVLKANGYDWSFVSDAGATVDSGSGSCHAGHEAARHLTQRRARGADQRAERRLLVRGVRVRLELQVQARRPGPVGTATRPAAARHARTRAWPTASTPSPSTRATRATTPTRRRRRGRSRSTRRHRTPRSAWAPARRPARPA